MWGGALPVAAMLFATPGADPPPEFAVLAIEFREVATFAGFPKVCPGTAPGEASEDDLCIAELYDVPVRMVRRISGPPRVAGRMLRYTAHNLYGPAGRRLLVQAFLWKRDWLFAGWWEMPDERGEVCLDAQDAENLQIKAQWSRWREQAAVEAGDGKSHPIRCLRL
jgi:hypothetical protein